MLQHYFHMSYAYHKFDNQMYVLYSAYSFKYFFLLFVAFHSLNPAQHSDKAINPYRII